MQRAWQPRRLIGDRYQSARRLHHTWLSWEHSPAASWGMYMFPAIRSAVGNKRSRLVAEVVAVLQNTDNYNGRRHAADMNYRCTVQSRRWTFSSGAWWLPFYSWLFISQSISHINVMLFHISQTTDTHSHCRHAKACKVNAGCKIQPVSRMSATLTHACSW